MILHIHGDLNPYYAQTLCLIYFPGSKFGEDEVEAEVTAVLAELGLDAPTAKQKGLIMKTLMPRVKGKADGALVQNVLARHLA